MTAITQRISSGEIRATRVQRAASSMYGVDTMIDRPSASSRISSFQNSSVLSDNRAVFDVHNNLFSN